MSLDRIVEIADFQAALRRFMRHSDRIASRHGLTPQRYQLLLMIKGAPDRSQSLTVGALAERLQLGDNTATELINRAEASGLVRRERSESDGRVVRLRLTDDGGRRLDAVLHDLDADRHRLEDALRHLTRSFLGNS